MKTAKRIVLTYILIVTTLCQLMAGPANPTQFQIVQPNGDTISIVHKGDENVSWYETLSGNIIDMDENGVWRYVCVKDGRLTLSEMLKATESSSISNVPSENRLAVMHILNLQRKTSIAYKDSIAGIASYDNINAQRVPVAISAGSSDNRYTPLPSKGNVKILTILVQFSDVKFQHQGEVRLQFSNIMNQNGYRAPAYSTPTGSVRDLYLDASYGQLDVSATVVGPYTVSGSRDYYGLNTDDGRDIHVDELVTQAIELAANDVSMEQFDNNGDGYVECVHIVYAGVGEDENSNNEAFRNAIWPHQSYISREKEDDKWISRYIVTPELYKTNYRGIGTICHELGHALGVPDFYDTDNEGSGGIFKGTGKFDLMGNGCWNEDANFPAHPNPYVKTQLFGWTQAQELTGNNTVYTLAQSETNPMCIHKISTPDGGYYLLENRQQDYLPKSGLLIYHVHPDIAQSVAGNFVWNNSINAGHPQMCYVVDASSSSEYPTGSPDSYGSISGGAVFPGYSSSPNIFFTSTSTPSNVGWDGQYPQNKDVAFIHEDGDNIKFVFNPSISGPSTLCTQGIYSIPDVPDMPWETSIDWSYGSIVMPDPQPVIFGEGQGTESISVVRNGEYIKDPVSGEYFPRYFYSGNINIMAKVSCAGDSYTMDKRITLPLQQDLRIQCDDNDGIMPIQYFGGATVHLSLREPSGNPSHIKWVCDFDFDDNLEGIPPGSHYTETYYGNSVAIPTYPTFGGTLTVSVYDIGDECNPDRHETWSQHFIPTIIYIDHTNPASGSVDIALSRVAAEGTVDTAVLSATTAQKEPYMGAYRLELWHDHYGLVRSLDSDGNRPTLTLDLYGLTPGIYYIRLLIDGEINSVSKLMVR